MSTKSNSSDQDKLIASRLDQIWITNNLLYRAIKCEVVNDELSNTDHSLLIGTIEVTNLLDKHNIATERKIKFKRKIFVQLYSDHFIIKIYNGRGEVTEKKN